MTAFLVWFLTVGQALVLAPIVARSYGVELPSQVFVVASRSGPTMRAVRPSPAGPLGRTPPGQAPRPAVELTPQPRT